MSSQEIHHAFFSKKQKERLMEKNSYKKLFKDHGKLELPSSNIYLTTDGREVEITEVVKDVDTYNKKTFTDFVYLGKVTKWVRFKYD